MARDQEASPTMNAQSERELRRDLAAAYRLVALFGWDDHVATHLSARLDDGTFLLNPFGMLFEEITASSLMRVDMDGNVIAPKDGPLNIAGYTVHSAILDGRPDVNAAMHLHTHDGVAVSAMKDGLLPLNQTALRFHKRIGYHAFEGVADDLDERARIVADLGDHKCLIMRHHGLLTAGVNIGEAFNLMYYLEKSCETQMMVLASNQPYSLPSEESCEKSARIFWGNGRVHDRDWPALMKLADQIDPSFRD